MVSVLCGWVRFVAVVASLTLGGPMLEYSVRIVTLLVWLAAPVHLPVGAVREQKSERVLLLDCPTDQLHVLAAQPEVVTFTFTGQLFFPF